MPSGFRDGKTSGKARVGDYFRFIKQQCLPVGIFMVLLVVVALVGGALITETVFAWPGLGQLVVQSIGSHDMSVVQACVVVIALVTMVANLLADLVYCLIDPRIRY